MMDAGSQRLCCCDVVLIIAALLSVVAVIWLAMYAVVVVGLIVTCPIAPALDVCGWWRAG